MDIEAALVEAQPLIRDLVATLRWDRERAEHVVLEHLTWLDAFEDDPWRLFHLTEAVQEDIQEEQLDTTWPACPLHGNHPLWLEPTDQPVVWRCPAAGDRVADLGTLASVAE